MIYKIPLYVEVEIEGGFNPKALSNAVQDYMAVKVKNVLKVQGESIEFKSIIDENDISSRPQYKVLRGRIRLIEQSQVIRKIASHE